jgi:hypothetical protein
MFDTLTTFLASVTQVGWLKCSLLLGALVDCVGAIQLLFFTKKTERDLQIPLQEGFWPTYAAVFLMVLTVLYVVAAMDPVRLLPIVGVAIVGRLIGGAFYYRYAWKKPGRQWLLFAFGTMNIALLFAYALILQRDGLLKIWAFLCWLCVWQWTKLPGVLSAISR